MAGTSKHTGQASRTIKKRIHLVKLVVSEHTNNNLALHQNISEALNEKLFVVFFSSESTSLSANSTDVAITLRNEIMPY